MKFSEKWLREWANPSVDRDTIIAQVTMAGLEVDGVEPAAGSFSGVVVGEVISVEPHPDADKLNVCQVSDGDEQFQVVCGANNVAVGLKVPFAKIGAVLPGDFTIKKAKLRGVESSGMLCAESELGLTESSEGLFELPGNAPIGQDINDYLELDDVTVEVDLTPNRSDCFSVAGIAREVSVINKCELVTPLIEPVAAVCDEQFPVVVENTEACPRYLGRVIKHINPGVDSPIWLKEKLRRCGLRSIDPVVDVTNFVMIELGQPMHAFDLNRLNGQIVVRNAKVDEELTLLDGQTLSLRDDTLVIADDQGSLALAGIMGGEDSGINDETQDLFLEVAFFNPLAIVGKARSYGLHTDSSHRFERGVDSELQARAMERATQLLLDIVGGEPGPITSAGDDSKLPVKRTVRLREAKVESLLGLKINAYEIEDILTRLGLDITEKHDDGWTFSVPSHRFDIEIEPDLIEEVGRVYGYNNLPKTISQGGLALRAEPESLSSVDQVKDTLIVLGYQEAITYSFVDPDLQAQVLPDVDSIALANPISVDMSVMRTSLLPGLLKALSYNQNRQQSRVRLFESGLKFVQQSGDIEQTLMLSGVVSGAANVEGWCNDKRTLDFYDVKADLEALFGALRSDVSFAKGEHPAMHPGQTAKLTGASGDLGFFGAVHPKLQKSLDLDGPVFVFELRLNELIQGQVPKFEEVSKFPEVRRDLAVLVNRDVTFADLSELIRRNAGEYLSDLICFDVYQDDQLGASLKSTAMGLIWRRTDRTFNEDEINSLFSDVVQALENTFDAKLRS